MAGLRKFILVVEDGVSRLNFLSMYELDFVIFRAASLEEAKARMQHNNFDYIMVDTDSDQQRAADFCRRVSAKNPRAKVVFLKDPAFALPEAFCADLVIDNTAQEPEIARKLEALLRPQRRN